MTAKKSKIVFEKETPPPSLTRGTVTSEGKEPIQRIDLTNDKRFAEYSKSANNRAAVVDYESKIPTYKVENGVHTLTLPNGRNIQGTAKELQEYKRAYMALKGIKDPRIEQSQRADMEAEVRNKIEKEELETQIRGENIPLNTEEIQEAPADELTADILQNADIRKQESLLTADRLTIGNILSPLVSANKLVSVFPEAGGIKRGILNLAGENKEFRDYLSDYSNYDNIQQIIGSDGDLATSDAEIKKSFELASNGYTKEADALFNKAISKKMRSLEHMKLISTTDQRKYVDDLINPMKELNSYFNENGELNDRIALRNAKIAGQRYGGN